VELKGEFTVPTPQEPQTLSEAIRYYSNEETCIALLASIRWPDGQICCTGCGEIGNTIWLAKQRRWKCRGCKKQFSIKVNTIFENSPVELSKWLVAVWMLANCRNGVSSYEIMRAIGVTQKSTWHMLHRIRAAMKAGHFEKMGGPDRAVESDEAFIGGKPRNMHAKRQQALKQAQNATLSGDTRLVGKTAIVGLFDRELRKIRAEIVPAVNRQTVQEQIFKHVARGSKLYTDESKVYLGLPPSYMRSFVNHVERYVEGEVHTNSLENFWSLLKRNLSGTYVAVEPFHLGRYLDEQVFRFNLRKKENTDSSRFKAVLKDIVGRSLTYAELTGRLTPAA
jgi:transposase-like protein